MALYGENGGKDADKDLVGVEAVRSIAHIALLDLAIGLLSRSDYDLQCACAGGTDGLGVRPVAGNRKEWADPEDRHARRSHEP